MHEHVLYIFLYIFFNFSVVNFYVLSSTKIVRQKPDPSDAKGHIFVFKFLISLKLKLATENNLQFILQRSENYIFNLTFPYFDRAASPQIDVI